MKLAGIIIFVLGIATVVLLNWPIIGGAVGLGGIVVAIVAEEGLPWSRRPRRQ